MPTAQAFIGTSDGNDAACSNGVFDRPTLALARWSEFCAEYCGTGEAGNTLSITGALGYAFMSVMRFWRSVAGSVGGDRTASQLGGD